MRVAGWQRTAAFTAPPLEWKFTAFEALPGGFPMLSTTGQFLIRGVVLLGAAVWTVTDALQRR